MTRRYILKSVRTISRNCRKRECSVCYRGDVSVVDLRLSTLEEELRSLWAASRKNSFDILVLKARANEADEQLRVAASKVEKLAEIVSEGWIQIKNFEQAQQFAEMRVLNTRWDSASKRCLLLTLQSFIRREMEINEVTAALANEELVFFMASAIVVFPLLRAWIWISLIPSPVDEELPP